ncbi:MAG: DUF308 domain-containing protein [Clostridia bacterium]|nr:DUF308 domain-containing protein [Clostridia bacterium]
MAKKPFGLQSFDKRSLLMLGILALVVGLCMIIFNTAAMHVICYSIGGLLLLYGAVDILRFFTGSGQRDSDYRSGLVDGALAAGIGLFFVLRPQEVTDTFGVIMGISLLIDGLFKLQFAVDMLRAHFRYGRVVLILALAAIVLGIVTFSVRSMTVVWIGIMLLLDGVFDIVCAYFLRQFDKTLQTARAKVNG